MISESEFKDVILWGIILGGCLSNEENRKQLEEIPNDACNSITLQGLHRALRVKDGRSIWAHMEQLFGVSPKLGKTVIEACLAKQKDMPMLERVEREMIKKLKEIRKDTSHGVGTWMIEVIKIITKTPEEDYGEV